MLRFELIKLLKKKYIILIIILALILSFINFFTIKTNMNVFDLTNTYTDIDYLVFKYEDIFNEKILENDKDFIEKASPYLEKKEHFQNTHLLKGDI